MLRLLTTVAALSLFACSRSPCEAVDCGSGECVADPAARCVCPAGMKAVSGPRCVAVCAPGTCASRPGAVCAAQGEAAQCTCPEGTSDDGVACQAMTPCFPNPCTGAHQGVCSIEATAARCACDPGFAPLGDGCETTPRWSCDAAHQTGDAAEPDECPLLAHTVAIDSSVTRSLSPAGDEDWFAVTVEAQRIYVVRASSPVGEAIVVELFDEAGLSSVEPAGGPSISPEFSFLARASGRLMVRVRSPFGAAVSRYELAFASVGLDDFPSDGTNSPLISSTISGAIQYPGDVDGVRLQLPSGRATRISLNTPSANARLTLDAPGATQRVLQRGEAVKVVAANLVVALSVAAPNARTVVPFTIEITDAGPDDFSDDVFGAVKLSGQTVTGAVEPGDRDVFTFTSEAAHAYLITTTSHGSAAATLLRSDGRALPLGARQVIEGLPAVDVLSWEGDGGYEFAVRDFGVDEIADDLGGATMLTDAQTAAIQLSGDVDVFRFTLQPGQRADVSVDNASLSVEILDAAGTLLGSSPLYAAGGGQFFVRVSGPAAERYLLALRVTDDDHGNTIATATPVAVGQPAMVQLSPGDVDVLRFQVRPGYTYDFAWGNVLGGRPTFSDGTNVLTRQVWGVIAPPGGVIYAFVEGSGPLEFTLFERGLDDFGNTLGNGALYTLGTIVSGDVQWNMDDDVFTFDAVAGELYALPNPSPQVLVQFVTPTFTSRFQTYAFRATATERIGVLVRGQSVTPYTLQIVHVVDREDGDTPATSTPIVVGTPIQAWTQWPEDTDFFAAPTVLDHWYAADSSSATTHCTPARFKALGATQFVQCFGSIATAYTLAVADFGLDAHGESIAAATPLPLATTASGTCPLSDDVDALRFTLSGASTVTITVTGDVTFQVLDAAGAIVTSSNGSQSLPAGDAFIVIRSASSAAATWTARVE